MGAYNRTNGDPCCAHSYLMDEVLRGKWGFEGHFVSDCWAVRDFHENHHVTQRPEESVKLALEKGCDVNCGCTYQRILDAYNEGILPLEHIKRSAVRLFTTRFLLGMFDKTEMDDIPYEVVECKRHLQLAERAAKESVVLLKNDGILPLDKQNLKTIGVIGPNANSRAALIGNYHGTASRYITVLEGIQDLAGEDFRVLYAQGSHLFKEREESLAKPDDRIAEAKIVAKHSDVVVLCLGLDETLEGEEGDAGNSYASGDKAGLELPAAQQKLLKAVAETGTPFIVCMMAGSAMELNFADAHANAVLQVWYPGVCGGKAVADILFGNDLPSGKLPITIYRDLQEMPDFTDYSMKGRTYRFIQQKPLYPFGYGLSYANIVLADTQADIADYSSAMQQGMRITAEVENKSERLGEQVVQVYAQVEGTPNEVPNPKLAAFARVSVEAGEKKQVELFVDKMAFGVIDEQGERCFDGSGATVFVGFGQPDQRTQELTGQSCKQIKIMK